MPSAQPRRTIGVLIENLTAEYQASIWAGMSEVAAACDVNLLCFSGGVLYSAADEMAGLRSVVYNLASAESVDGLIVSASIGSYGDAGEFLRFLSRYRPLPMVVIAQEFPKTPCILADQYGGMYDLITHFIEGHSLRQIAFICGPEDNPDAQRRYQAYLDALAGHDIPFDPHLVLPGAFDSASGVEAIRILCDERGLRPRVDFEAVVAASDSMALSAIDALQARGFFAPHDVAVAGFDDFLVGRMATPPLTTVHQPVHELGRQAAEMVLAQLSGQQPPERVTLPTRLVIRQSCGCPDPAMLFANAPPPSDEQETASLSTLRETLVSEIVQAVGGTLDRDGPWIETLVDACIAGMESPDAFIAGLREILHRTVFTYREPTAWLPALFILRYRLPSIPAEMWQKAQRLVGEMVLQEQARRKLLEAQQARILREIGDALSTSLDIAELLDAVAQQLPRIGIRRCYIALYHLPDCPQGGVDNGDQGCLVLAYDETGRAELVPNGRHFPVRQLLPRDVLPSDRRYVFNVAPLLFHGEQLGFVVFDVGPADGRIYETLRELLGNAVKRALLLRDRQRVEEELERERDLLRALMDTVPDAIYFKDTSSRFVRVNRAQARTLGVDDPAAVVGKTDFDFFLPAHAQDAFADEQIILQTGQPITDKVEQIRHADGRMHWVSTTKIPIRGRSGQIEGTAGITRDITERVWAEERLRRYAAELEQANEEIKNFAFIVSHDLRAPLVNLKGFATELEDALERVREAIDETLPQMSEARKREVSLAMDEDIPEALQFINSSVAYMDRFVAAMLKLSRLGRQELRLEPIDMNALVRTALESLAHQIAERGTQVTVAPLPTIVADRTSMEQIVGNIVGNAVKYLAPDRPGKIEITAEENESEVLFRVRDNGRGIAAHDMDKVFAPFRRAGAQDVPGEGMGLAYVQALVRRHGGKVWCESELGVGTTFSVLLPKQGGGG